ncbi:MAG: hypothetical protein AB1512_11620 [Thermodesulfobacteriota bacterium]
MRIAIPVWGEKVSPLLDAASRLLIVETDRMGELNNREDKYGCVNRVRS